jgi:hypothetical protein
MLNGFWLCLERSSASCATVAIWFVRTSASAHMSQERTGPWRDSQGVLHYVHDVADSTNTRCQDNPKKSCDDDPDATQRIPKQQQIFWLDDPGSFKDYNIGGPWDLLDQMQHFASKVSNRFGICAEVPSFFRLVVDPGGNLDRGRSPAALGAGPTQ